MNWIKQHYEKLLIALALLVLITSAVVLSLRVGTISQEISEQAPSRRKNKGKTIDSMNLGDYSNVLVAVKEPPLWTDHKVPIFNKEASFQPVTTADNTNTAAQAGPFYVRLTHEPFKLLFKSYTSDGQTFKNFQLNFLTISRTFFVPGVGMEVADRFESTGYFIKNFEKKTTSDPLTAGAVKDISEITVQHEGEDPIVLVLNRIAEGREPVAWILCKPNTPLLSVRRTSKFDCDTTSYKVIDINSKQMLIMDLKSGDRKTIPMSSAK